MQSLPWCSVEFGTDVSITFVCSQHYCYPERQQSPGEGSSQEGQRGRLDKSPSRSDYHRERSEVFILSELSLSGVTLPVFEHYQEGGDSKCGSVYLQDVWIRFLVRRELQRGLSDAVCVCQVMNSPVWPEEESSSPG